MVDAKSIDESAMRVVESEGLSGFEGVESDDFPAGDDFGHSGGRRRRTHWNII